MSVLCKVPPDSRSLLAVICEVSSFNGLVVEIISLLVFLLLTYILNRLVYRLFAEPLHVQADASPLVQYSGDGA